MELLKSSPVQKNTSEKPGLYQAESATGGRRRDCPRPFRGLPLRMMFVCCLCLGVAAAASEEAESRNHAKLMEILGPDAVVPDALRDAVNQSEPGERIYEDLDKDGDPDVVTYLDPDKKHTKKSVLVRVLDDDDDLVEGQWPDHDNDCYVADWDGDGAVDRVLDWWDDDGDGDADRMDIY
ncbi:MAG: hypothetical protein GY851_28930, partial [bacterium]|nr:hypothetical protein [bacterium]